jgi:hypothetical protein
MQGGMVPHGGKEIEMGKIFILFALSLFVLVAYTSAPAEVTDNKAFDVVLKVEDRGGLKNGKNIIFLYVKDPSGNAVEGASISVTPWMPSMNHGTPWTSKITDLGKGEYRTNIPLTMGGHWEFRIKIKAAGREDTLTLDFPDVKE